MSQNTELIIRDHWKDCLGKGEFKSGGSHRHDHMTNEEKTIIRDEFVRLKMFESGSSNEKVQYNQKIRRVWENLNPDSIDIFLERNRENYELKKAYRY